MWRKINKICVKCEKNGKWCSTFERNAVWSLLGFVLGALAVTWMAGLSTLTIDIMKLATGAVLVVSAGVAAQQFRFNRKQAERANKWNTKQLAMTQMHASRKVMKEAISKLHGCLDIQERKEPYELYEIHDAYGVRLSDGTFCFHGEEGYTDIKLLPTKQTDQETFRCVEFSKTHKGREIKDAVINYLSEYEYLCSAINNKIFDDNTVKSLLRGSIVGKYKLFKKYIEHQQKSTGNPTYFSEFVSVAKRYEKEK